MTQRTQFARAYATGESVTGQREGTPFTNFADLNLQIQGPLGPIELLAIRAYSATADYAAGDLIVYNGEIWSAQNPVSAGNPPPSSDWLSLVAGPFSGIVGEVGWDFVTTITNENVTKILFSNGVLRVDVNITYDAQDNPVTITYDTSTDSGATYVPYGTLTLTYDSDGNVATGTWS